jgi:colanic acid/amylovoran biosynthesis protein
MATVATLAAAYSANKGAASMLQALIDNLPERAGPVRIIAVSTHPGPDRKAYDRAGLNVEVVSQKPIELALLHIPLAALAGLLRWTRLPWRWTCRPAALRALADADVVADLSGISFVDGRRLVVLVYNALVVMVPLLLGRPVVKCSQALGPFNTKLNRWLAGLVLPRLTTICPRGRITLRHLEEFGLTNLAPAADLAFCMRVPLGTRERMRNRLAEAAPGPYLILSPSQVVATYCRRQRVDYAGIMAQFVDSVVATKDYTVVMIAHSAQPQSRVNHLNDLPLCRDIMERLRSSERVVFFDEDLLPTDLRAVIAEGALLVTSRFHAMISALAETTPLLVISWSHKYAEVLDAFDMGEAAMPFEQLSNGTALVREARKVIRDGDRQIKLMRCHGPAAIDSAQQNIVALMGTVSSQRSLT